MKIKIQANREKAPATCKDPRHGTPCALPCEACEADGCLVADEPEEG